MLSSTPSLGRKWLETPIRDARTARIPFITAGKVQPFRRRLSCAVWYRSSQKMYQDRTEQRSERLAAARLQLKQLQQRANGKHHGPTLEEASDKILKQCLSWPSRLPLKDRYAKSSSNKDRVCQGPTPCTIRAEQVLFRGERLRRMDVALQVAKFCWDGLFPLITKQSHASTLKALDKYKYQPFLEKRHQQLKSVLEGRARILEESRTGGVDAAVIFCVFAGLRSDRTRVTATHARGRVGRITLVPGKSGQ